MQRTFYRKRWTSWAGALLCVTHSDRAYSMKECDLNYLEGRWSQPDRLPPQIPFENLRHATESSRYYGEVTVWRLGRDFKPELLLHFRPDGYKPQHAIWHNQHLWVLGTEILEVFDSKLKRVGEVNDPWLAGGHTILPDGKGRLYLSCSASDSILVVGVQSLKVEQVHRLPEELYGRNYELTREHSVVDHFIPNDLQLTHVNCACPWKDGILVSCLAPGCIGFFDPQGRYKELVRGFVGCHGVRVDSATDTVYFADSCVGTVNFLDSQFQLDHRLTSRSFWLHDAQKLSDNGFALAVAERNAVEIVDMSSGEILQSIDCAKFGESPQFLYYGT